MRGNVHMLGTSKDNALSLQSGTCQAGVNVNSCQVGLRSAPLPRARAAEGGPTLVCASKSQVRKHTKMCALSLGRITMIFLKGRMMGSTGHAKVGPNPMIY